MGRNEAAIYNNIGIDRSQQRDLHNARCFFEHWIEKYNDVLGQRAVDDFKHAYKYFTRAHDPIRAEENKRFDERHEHFKSMQKLFNYKTVWSDFDIERLDESLPLNYLDITHVKYYNQLVAVEKREGALGLDWLAVWAAADKAITQSGDTHHIFVEGIYQREEDPKGVYQIITGS